MFVGTQAVEEMSNANVDIVWVTAGADFSKPFFCPECKNLRSLIVMMVVYNVPYSHLYLTKKLSIPIYRRER